MDDSQPQNLGLVPDVQSMQVAVPSPEAQFQDEYARQLQSLAQQNYSHLPESELAKQAQAKALDALAQQKQAAQQRMTVPQSTTSAPQSPGMQQADYNKQLAHITQENEKRALIGLPPAALPQAPPMPQAAPATPILRPEDLAGLPDAAAQAAVQPTPEQFQAEYNNLVKPYQQERAKTMALDAVDKLRQESEQRQKAREDELQAKLDKVDARVRTKSFAEIFQTGSVGQKLGAALAILAGGVSQGLTGAKSNPVVDFMDRVTDQQAAKDKLTADEKESLRRQVYEQGQTELKKLEQATSNAARKDQLNILSQELELKKQELQAKLKATIAQTMPSDVFSGRELTKQEMIQARANKELNDRVITLPNGKAFLGNNTSAALEFNKFATESFNALSLIEKYKKLAEKGRAYSPKDRGSIYALQKALTGALRVPITGPGSMTKEDKEDLLASIGDPLAFTTLKPVEMAKIQQIEDALKTNTINKARLSGISGDVFNDVKFYNLNGRAVREDALINAYKQRMPNLSEAQIKSAIAKTLPGL